MKKQINVIYKGRVQGVGFRFTAESIARKLGLCGWVKNLGSGDVEVLAQGLEEKLKKFLEEINSCLSSYISDAEITWDEARKKFKDFTIEF